MLSTVDEHVIRELIKDNRLPTQDLHFRRIVNADDPVDPQDYATKNYIDTEIESVITSVGLSVDTGIIEGVTPTVTIQTDDASIAGNEFEVRFYWPTSNILSGGA